MPIAHCYYNPTLVLPDMSDVPRELAESLGLRAADIHLSFVQTEQQSGQTYDLFIQLQLPSLWSAADVERIQTLFYETLRSKLQLEPAQVFLTTSIVASGHVVEEGQIQNWPET